MIRFLPLALLALIAPAAPAHAVDVEVLVQNMTFVNGTVTVTQGSMVTWRFDDTVDHTTTSNQAFWASKQKSKGVDKVVFASAGRYAYHCAVHPHMTGKITVPLVVAKVTGGKRVQWASAAEAGRNYDVQVKRPGSTKWVFFRKGTSKLAKAVFKPRREGRYVFRARTRNLANGLTSGWSPATRVRVR